MMGYRFRGKRIDSGEWIYGYYFCDEDLNTHYIQGYDYYQNEEGSQREAFFIEVDGETVGQYIGLEDNRGKEIYHGDILSTDLQRPYNVVIFKNGSFMLNCNDGGNDYYDIFYPTDEKEKGSYAYGDVVGNTYDNADLLKDYEPIKE